MSTLSVHYSPALTHTRTHPVAHSTALNNTLWHRAASYHLRGNTYVYACKSDCRRVSPPRERTVRKKTVYRLPATASRTSPTTPSANARVLILCGLFSSHSTAHVATISFPLFVTRRRSDHVSSPHQTNIRCVLTPTDVLFHRIPPEATLITRLVVEKRVHSTPV